MSAMSQPDRAAAGCGIGGSVVLLVGTYLHPMRADPNDPVAAFTEYAADRLWIASHLVQLAGSALIVAALLLLSRRLDATKAAPWSRFSTAAPAHPNESSRYPPVRRWRSRSARTALLVG